MPKKFFILQKLTDNTQKKKKIFLCRRHDQRAWINGRWMVYCEVAQNAVFSPGLKRAQSILEPGSFVHGFSSHPQPTIGLDGVRLGVTSTTLRVPNVPILVRLETAKKKFFCGVQRT